MSSDLQTIDPRDRRVYFVPHLAAGDNAPQASSDDPDPAEERKDVGNVRGLTWMDHDPAGLVISSRLTREETGDDLHAPVIDLDLPARLVPSATPGHFHLFLDVAMDWPTYVHLLEALAEAGLVQPGYVDACVVRGTTDVRAYPETKRPTT